MIIDCHSHVCAAPELYAWKALLTSSRGTHGYRPPKFTDEFVRDHRETKRNLDTLAKVGTDMQFLSPRPFQQMHDEKPNQMVEAWAVGVHNYIAQQVKLFPDKFRGVCGMPQMANEPVSVAFPELERCVKELGFVGTLIDTDPGEGDNSTPILSDKYWYPLWEKMCELDIPGLIHSGGCRNGRESYSQHFITEESLAILSLVDSHVFDDFPNLKIIVAHGGGSIPYQVGRWRAGAALHGGKPSDFDNGLKKLYFDTCIHNKKSLEMLIGLVGPERVLFGTENPGSGSAMDPETGRTYDDIKPQIEEIDFLTEADRALIFEGNARRLFTRLNLADQKGAKQAARA
ncbi:MAG TPA: amidohydrolase family protein [Hyphomicrobiales bacterium]|nr:amidohydrolase family protein [Hyphomicrobiales bacterium]